MKVHLLFAVLLRHKPKLNDFGIAVSLQEAQRNGTEVDCTGEFARQWV